MTSSHPHATSSRPRVPILCAWFGTALVTVAIAACAGSYVWEAAWYGRGRAAAVTRGNLAAIWWPPSDPYLTGLPRGWTLGPPRYGNSWLRHLTSAPGVDGAQIPMWPIILSAALLTVLAARRSLRRHGTRCRGCDYDLTGNTTGICPECGRPIPGKAGGRAKDVE